MKEFRDNDGSSVYTDGETSSDGKVARAAVLAPGRVTSLLSTIFNIDNYRLMLGYLNAHLWKKPASGVMLHGPLQRCAGCQLQRKFGTLSFEEYAARSDHRLGMVFTDLVGPRKLETVT